MVAESVWNSVMKSFDFAMYSKTPLLYSQLNLSFNIMMFFSFNSRMPSPVFGISPGLSILSASNKNKMGYTMRHRKRRQRHVQNKIGGRRRRGRRRGRRRRRLPLIVW